MMKEAWSSHYTQLLNEEFEWSRDDLIAADPVEGLSVCIESEWVKQDITQTDVTQNDITQICFNQNMKLSQTIT